MNELTKKINLEIKPCPFCGSEGRISSDGGEIVTVQCSKAACDAHQSLLTDGSRLANGEIDMLRALSLVLEKWNKRI